MKSGVCKAVGGGLLVLALLSGCAGAPVAHPNRVKARENLSGAQQLLMQNHPAQALSSIRKALRMHRLSDDLPGTIDDMNRLASLSFYLGRVDASRQWIDRALLLERVSEYPGKRVETYILSAEIAPPGQAGVWIEEAHRIADAMPSGSGEKERLEARLFQVEGMRASARKDYRGAIPLFRKALALDHGRKDPLSVATDHASLGRNYYLSGDYKEALRHFGMALSGDERLRNHAGIAFDLEGISLAKAGIGDYREAARTMMEASGVEMGLGRMEMSRRDVAFVRTLFKSIRTPESGRFREILGHWFDAD